MSTATAAFIGTTAGRGQGVGGFGDAGRERAGASEYLAGEVLHAGDN